MANRRAYAQSLAQRNALIARIRSGAGSRNSLHSWDAQLSRRGVIGLQVHSGGPMEVRFKDLRLEVLP